ncbi:hypothetical protein CEXT_597891 [Caerostris extrusa]|uniref:Uncharacterized protein n=1 Tax=Caerostris extrusa TaxID=172846 RepID=A0AAV4UC07_CAEEX|nr:hypothetical protein CEXT_597891 [Caerostris extrusa]
MIKGDTRKTRQNAQELNVVHSTVSIYIYTKWNNQKSLTCASRAERKPNTSPIYRKSTKRTKNMQYLSSALVNRREPIPLNDNVHDIHALCLGRK